MNTQITCCIPYASHNFPSIQSLDQLVEQNVGLCVIQNRLKLSSLHFLIIKLLPLIVTVHRVRYIMTAMSMLSKMLYDTE